MLSAEGILNVGPFSVAVLNSTLDSESARIPSNLNDVVATSTGIEQAYSPSDNTQYLLVVVLSPTYKLTRFNLVILLGVLVI